MVQSPSSQGADDAIDYERSASGIEVSCLKILDRLAKGTAEFRSRIGADQEAALDEQPGQVGDLGAGVTE